MWNTTAVEDNHSNGSSFSWKSLKIRNLFREFGILFAIEFLSSLIVLVCVSVSNTTQMAAFGYLIFVGLLGMLHGGIWAVLTVFDFWPNGELPATQYIKRKFCTRTCRKKELYLVPSKAHSISAQF